MLLTGTTNTVGSGKFPEMMPHLIIILIMLLVIIGIINANKKRKTLQAKLRQSGILTYTAFNHVNGLPVPENLLCEILSYEDGIEFRAGTTNIRLQRKKITDMCIRTDTEIQNQAVSSVGRAIAGGVMFGTLGAMIGGRVKTKKIKTTTPYLIITYTGEQGELKYVSFNIKNDLPSATKLVNEFRELNVNSGIRIEL